MAPGRPIRARVATVRTLADPATGEKLDRALVLWFPAPHSYTGEDMIEFQVTGSPAVVSGVLSGLAKMSGFRAAGPGEFSLRAFENGKLDLTEVEGLSDLIEAETAAQRRRAFQIAGGSLRERVDAIRDLILEAMVRVESQIDFSDADDFAEFSSDLRERVGEASSRIEQALASSSGAEKLRDGFVVAVTGPPNAGKSTLVNYIARRDVSIVSAEPGTTRDVIEVFLELDGFPVSLLDTAGLRESGDGVEAQGIARARARAKHADLVLWVTEDGGEPVLEGLDWNRLLLVQTKCDLLTPGDKSPSDGRWRVSGVSGEGVSDLLQEIARIAGGCLEPACSAVLIRERHRLAFQEAASALERCADLGEADGELIAEDLRIAAQAMERVTGRIGVEEVLDEVFRGLCVGK